jgi:eukaryotic-like serine/threonine-protein kinase
MTPERWKQLKPILDGALNGHGTASTAFLRQACGADSSLFEEARSFLQFNGQDDALEGSALSHVVPPRSPLLGRTLGKYKILRQIGSGGMGAVFLAERTDGAFQQKVAVKILRASLGTEPLIRRFYAERQILAALDHPNIARIIDGGSTSDDLPYFVMEHVDGASIVDHADKHGLSVTERLDLFRSVCAAVSYAHRKLIVHRDIKPSNVLVSETGDVKLVDFGIARLCDERENGRTATQHLAFTPEYASPEQINGLPLTTSTDIYSLGVLLCELLTGSRPLSLDGRSMGQMIKTAATADRTRPSVLAADRPQISRVLEGDLDNIILKAVHKEPERRYSSVERLSDDIALYLRGRPVSARPDSLFYRARKFANRNRLFVSAASFAVVSLLAGIVCTTYLASAARAERVKAEKRFNDVRNLANSFIFEINDEIERSPIKAREIAVGRALEYLDSLSAEAGDDSELRSELAAAYEKVGGLQSELFQPSLGKSSEALASHEKSLSIRRQLYERTPTTERGLDIVRSLNNIGGILAMTGDARGASDRYSEAVELATQLHRSSPDDRQVRYSLAKAHARLGQAILRSGSLNSTLLQYERALDLYGRLAIEEPSDRNAQRSLSTIQRYIGYVHSELGRPEAAIESFRQALDISTGLANSDPQNGVDAASVVDSRFWVAFAQIDLGQADAAELEFRSIAAELERQSAADPADLSKLNSVADAHLEWGLALKSAKRFSEAQRVLGKAIGLYRKVFDADPKSLATKRQIYLAMLRRGDSYLKSGNLDIANHDLSTALQELTLLTAADPANTEWLNDVAVCHARLGEINLMKGRKAAAGGHFRTAINILDELTRRSPEHAKRMAELDAVRRHLSAAS